MPTIHSKTVTRCALCPVRHATRSQETRRSKKKDGQDHTCGAKGARNDMTAKARHENLKQAHTSKQRCNISWADGLYSWCSSRDMLEVVERERVEKKRKRAREVECTDLKAVEADRQADKHTRGQICKQRARETGRQEDRKTHRQRDQRKRRRRVGRQTILLLKLTMTMGKCCPKNRRLRRHARRRSSSPRGV